MFYRLLTVLCFCFIWFSFASTEAIAEKIWRENDWNFVSASMNISGGIPADASGVLDHIRLTGELRVATEPYFPPQEFIDPALNGQAQYVGSDMKLAALIAERMGVMLTIVPMEFSEVLESVAEDECDLAISALSYTPGRASEVTLSKGYYFGDEGLGAGLLIREEDAETIMSLQALSGRTIVAQSGSVQEAFLADSVTDYLEFRRLSSAQDCYEAVAAGWADAAAVNVEAANAYIEKNRNCGLTLVSGVVFRQEPQFAGDRIAAKKGETQLIAFVNGVIDEVLRENLYVSWYQESEARAAELGL